MNKFIISFVLLSCIGCVSDKQQKETSTNFTKGEQFLIAKAKLPKKAKREITNGMQTISDELYTLQFKIEKTENNQHNLVIDVKLHKGSSFISPFETKKFKGKFYMDLGSYKDLSLDESIIETPQAVAEYDGFENAPVIWVKENTTYTQLLNIKTDEGFEVLGRVIFTIEPRCSLETIPFGISYKNGVMTLIDPKC